MYELLTGAAVGMGLGVFAGWRLGERRAANRSKELADRLAERLAAIGGAGASASLSWVDPPSGGSDPGRGASSTSAAATRSGLYDAPLGVSGEHDPQFGRAEMVARVAPETWEWVAVSLALADFLGGEPDRVKARPFLEWVVPEDRARLEEGLREALRDGEAHGLICRAGRRSGDRTVVELNVGTRYAADGTVAHLRCHVTDLTERLKQSQERKRRARKLERLNAELSLANSELARLKDRYSDLYQNAPAMYFSLDPRGRFLVCNDTMLRNLGYRRRELIGRPYVGILAASRQGTFEDRFQKFIHEGTMESENIWMSSDGREIDVLVKGTAVRDQEGRLLRSRSVAQDITKLKQLEGELRRNNERLARANEELSRKIHELDEFGYVVSHDLQEPVRTMIGFSRILREDCASKLEPAEMEHLGFIHDASIRMRTLIQDLHRLSRAGRVVEGFAAVPLEGMLDEVVSDLAELIRSKGAEVGREGALPVVWGDRARIRQLLSNLVANGLKYNRSERPWVRVSWRGNDGRGMARVAVSDNGIGIDPEFHGKIFGMFQRLHRREEFEGTGAGLAICQKIAEAHGGSIGVESRPGEGSTFVVALPMAPVGGGEGVGSFI